MTKRQKDKNINNFQNTTQKICSTILSLSINNTVNYQEGEGCGILIIRLALPHFVCLSQVITWIFNAVFRGNLCVQLFEVTVRLLIFQIYLALIMHYIWYTVLIGLPKIDHPSEHVQCSSRHRMNYF